MSPIAAENRDRYPADWPSIAASIKFGRAGSRCECTGECGRGPSHLEAGRCGEVHGMLSRHGGRVHTILLTVGHLDHTPEHSDPGNLRAWCQGCHLFYDVEHHRRSRLVRELAQLEAAGQLTLDGSRVA